MAAEFAISIAPPRAWTIRKAISHSAPDGPRNGSSDSASEAALKTAKPRL